jgi:hypothetical protein
MGFNNIKIKPLSFTLKQKAESPFSAGTIMDDSHLSGNRISGLNLSNDQDAIERNELRNLLDQYINSRVDRYRFSEEPPTNLNQFKRGGVPYNLLPSYSMYPIVPSLPVTGLYY